MDEESAGAIAAELDAVHVRAQRAFESCDLEAYMAIFSPDLAYRRANGQSISRDQLARDVSIQFRRLKTAVSSYSRESIRLNGDEVQELLEQRASASATAFLIVHRIWDLKRKALYTWRNSIDGWQIVEATILEEQLSSRGFSLGLLPPPLIGDR